MSKPIPKPDPLWVTRLHAAEVCGMADRTWHDAIRPRVPASGVRGRGAALRYFTPAIVAVLVDYRLEQAKPKGPLPGDETDAMLDGADSPALERYRAGRAAMVEMDLAERRREIVKSSVVRDALRAGVSALRSTGEMLVRAFGNEAGKMHNEGVDAFESAAGKVIAEGGK